MDKDHLEKAAYFDKGLISKKGIYFHTASAFSRQNLFCIAWGGELYCDAPYEIHRKTEKQLYDYYMIMRIIEGELNIVYEDRQFAASAGNIVFMDSHIPNHYWASSRIRYQFLHFNGPLADSYYKLLHDQLGVCFAARSETAYLFNTILQEMSLPNSNDQKLSLWMYNLIAGFALPTSGKMNPDVIRAEQYINDHFQEPVNVDEMAASANLSRHHFSRIFKQETGLSPHQYLINIRLQHARELLSAQNVSLEDIASTCGFSSTSHFISTFKKETGMTPVNFKKHFNVSWPFTNN